jgi:hypothetical protein
MGGCSFTVGRIANPSYRINLGTPAHEHLGGVGSNVGRIVNPSYGRSLGGG